MAKLPVSAAVGAALDHLVRSRHPVAVVTRVRDPAEARVVLLNRAFADLTGLAEGDVASLAILARALRYGHDGSFTSLELGFVVSVAPLTARHCIVLVREVQGDERAFECESA